MLPGTPEVRRTLVTSGPAENGIWWGLPCLRKDGDCFPRASEEDAGDHGFPSVEEGGGGRCRQEAI
jgi:hypothetical protein